MAGTVGCAAQGFREEEVLHVDYDEGCFLGIDGYGGCGCLEADARGDWGGLWVGRVGQVETVAGAVEPEV